MMGYSETVVHVLYFNCTVVLRLEHLPAEVHSPAYIWELLLQQLLLLCAVSKQVNFGNYWFSYIWVTFPECVTQLRCL